MTKRNSKVVYGLLLTIGLLGFILQIFIFEKPDGNFGMVLCMIESALIVSSTVRLYQLSKGFRGWLSEFIKIIFRF